MPILDYSYIHLDNFFFLCSRIVLNDSFHANIMPFIVNVMNNNIAETTFRAERACIEVLITPKDTGFMVMLYHR